MILHQMHPFVSGTGCGQLLYFQSPSAKDLKQLGAFGNGSVEVDLDLYCVAKE